MRQRCIRPLCLVIVISVSIEAFTPSCSRPGTLHTTRRLERTSILPTTAKNTAAATTTTTTTRLHETVWERIGLEESDEPNWYVLNCIAGLEPLLLQQCRQICKDLPDAHRFVVPTQRTTRSHGAKRMVAETKVKFPGYVFAKLRLCPEVYEALSGLDLMRSFMGTINYRRQRRLPPVPIALNEIEVENYGLDEWVDEDNEEEHDSTQGVGSSQDDFVIIDSAEAEAKAAAKNQVNEEDLKVYKGLKVDDMIKVTKKSQYIDDDGVIRRLKDGQIFVRFYTYGSTFDVWMQPDDVRKLTSKEILQGLSGPQQPITQQDFDGPYQERDSQRRPYEELRGAPQQRNRRQDRTAAEYKSTARLGGNGEDRAREERNWNWYQDQKQKGDKSFTASDSEGRVFRARKSDNERDGGSDWAMGDVDSQWGRQPERQQRRERNRVNDRLSTTDSDDWSSFVSPAKGAAPRAKTSSDDFFDSLVADLSTEKTNLGDMQSSGMDKSAEDDFFASLMNDITDATSDSRRYDQPSPSRPIRSASKQQDSSPDDEFFASLEQQIDEMNSGPSTAVGGGRDADDFFAQIASEDFLATAASVDASSEPALSRDALDLQMMKGTRSKEIPDQFLGDNLEPSLPVDLSKMTVPALKDLLRERGLKVSGTKSELIKRISSS